MASAVIIELLYNSRLEARMPQLHHPRSPVRVGKGADIRRG